MNLPYVNEQIFSTKLQMNLKWTSWSLFETLSLRCIHKAYVCTL